MRPRCDRRLTMQFESLEGRNAPSGGLATGLHQLADARREHAGGHQIRAGEVHVLRADDHLPRHGGRDERPGHDAADDNRARHDGRDDGADHDANDDHNRNRHGRG